MGGSKDFTPFDFFRLAKDLSEHEVAMKIKLAQAGIREPAPADQTSSTSRP